MIMDRDYSMDAWQLPPALSGKILWLCFCYHPCGLQGVLVPACLFWPQPGQRTHTTLRGIFNLENYSTQTRKGLR